MTQHTPHTILPTIKQYLLNLQARLINIIEEQDGEAKFINDEWQHVSGGGGISCILQSGRIIEKAGVNFSHVKGNSLPQAATSQRPELIHSAFQALGVSVVIHPYNPFVPTTHFNIRYILVEKDQQPFQWWFGGGFDLTPYYAFEEDCRHFHAMAKAACDPFGAEVYKKCKQRADQYFYLPHRKEPRGIGGIFFDDLNTWELETCFSFMQQVGEHFIKAYQPILAHRQLHAYGERERQFQLFRRGRYVEFNLLYDRGTLFGLQSGGRTESILMSLPPVVAWPYQTNLELGPNELALYETFLKPKDWA